MGILGVLVAVFIAALGAALLVIKRVSTSNSIYQAAVDGDHEKLGRFLERGVDVNTRYRNGRTLLHAAAEEGNTELARFLLDRGADVNVRDNDGVTPIHIAAMGVEDDLVRFLLKRGADITAKENSGNTPLHNACIPIMAVPTIPRLLLSHGADINARDRDGETPLHKAARSFRSETVDLLLQRGAIHNIHTAAMAGDAGKVEEFLDSGIAVDSRDRYDATPLHWAAEYGRTEVAEILLEHGADINARKYSALIYYSGMTYGNTPLHCATRWGRAEVVELLLRYGADVNVQNEDGITPLHNAVRGGDSQDECVKMVNLLLSHGANAEVADIKGKTPQRWALERDNRDAAEILQRAVPS